MSLTLKQRLKKLARWIWESNYLVIFTGAGISTESGLPDFRGPNGLWTRQGKGLPLPASIPWNLAKPNSAHLAIVELQEMGKLSFLISQNVDNLHLKSGIKPELLAELHGNITKLRCRRCQRTVDRLNAPPKCECGGEFVKSVVDFGEPLPEKDLSFAYYHSSKADLFIVVGSSLVVTPAAEMPKIALKAGAKLVIINQGETPYDDLAHLRFFKKAGEVLPNAVKLVKGYISASG